MREVASYTKSLTALSLAVTLAWAAAGAATAAAATPRRVAVVNAASDQNAGAVLAGRVRAALAVHADLAPVPPGDLARALEEALAPPAPDPVALEEAGAAMARARAAMARFAYTPALEALEEAEARLLAIVPAPPATALLARLAFERGRIRLRHADMAGATRELTLARRLDPDWDSIDPSVYPPELVQAFETAGAEVTPDATLEVTSLFDGATVYIDGRRAGRTPLRAHLAPGVHYIAGTFADSHITGERLSLGREPRAVKLHFARVTLDERARSWRMGLVRQVVLFSADRRLMDEIARSVTELTGADAVVVIADDAAGTLYIAAHDERTAARSTWRPIAAISIESLLATLVQAPFDPRLPRSPAEEPAGGPWWQSNWGKATIGAGVAASILTVALRSILDRKDTVTGSICCSVDRSGTLAR